MLDVVYLGSLGGHSLITAGYNREEMRVIGILEAFLFSFPTSDRARLSKISNGYGEIFHLDAVLIIFVQLMICQRISTCVACSVSFCHERRYRCLTSTAL